MQQHKSEVKRQSVEELVKTAATTNKMSTSPMILQSMDVNDEDNEPRTLIPSLSTPSTLSNHQPPLATSTAVGTNGIITNSDSFFRHIDHNQQQTVFDPQYRSVLLLDDKEQLVIANEKQFLGALQIPPGSHIKVVAIFGNTGDGKSHTLNHTFFDGEEVFRTSNSQTSCTLGVWAYYHRDMRVLFLDTEGLLGVSTSTGPGVSNNNNNNHNYQSNNTEHQRTRLLLKVLAVSDCVIYRTRAERLQRDMYTFLGGASEAYRVHFSGALEQILRQAGSDLPSRALGPALLIFHETRYTSTLQASADVTQSAEDLLRSYFTALNLPYDGFSSIRYIGCETLSQQQQPNNYKELLVAVQKEVESNEVRSPRNAKYIYLTIKALNAKFSSRIVENDPKLYLPAYFTCPEKCQSCGVGCKLSMGHKNDNQQHSNSAHCQLQHQYKNFIYLCKACYNNGTKQVVNSSSEINTDLWVNLSSLWSGYVINCPKCGQIYQSRQHWYGNKDPRDEAVIAEIVHVWSGDELHLQDSNRSIFGTQNSAQKVLDGMTTLSNAVVNVSSQPTKLISDWVTDQIAPAYWRPNHQILECFKCKIAFSTNASKHHCRMCGEGFCEACSTRTQPVLSRGWTEAVRVCDYCYKPSLLPSPMNQHRPDILNSASKQVVAANNSNSSVEQTPPPIVGHQQQQPQLRTNEVRARRFGESVLSSLSVVKSVLDYPKDLIKDSVRPNYWQPDSECVACAVCQMALNVTRPLHHCRDCGRGVCDACSLARRPVPLRGWDAPVFKIPERIAMSHSNTCSPSSRENLATG